MDVREIQIALLILSESVSAGTLMIQFVEGAHMKFESVGRDCEGGYLLTDRGETVRLRADESELDELLSRDEVHLEEMDTAGNVLDQYPINAVPFLKPGFGA